MEALSDITVFENLGVALLTGFVVGLERGWSLRERGEGARFAGVRTFMLIGLLGGLAAVLSRLLGDTVLYLAFAAVALVLAAVVLRGRGQANEDQGITTVIAALVTFVLGILAGLGAFSLAASAAVVTAVVLGMKPVLHRWLLDIERRELTAALKLMVITGVVLPILPDKGYGPWAALNPYEIWWMVVLISAISFTGYFAIKWSAPAKGIMVTALLGGLASSTAIAVSFSRLGRDNKDMARLLAVGIIASSTMMLPRMLLVAAAVAPVFAMKLLPVLAAATAAGAAVAWRLWPRQPQPSVDLSTLSATSFDFGVPVRFGLLLAGILLLAAAARTYLGDQGLYLVAALAGLSDVDAMTLTAANNIKSGLPPGIAMGAVLTAAIVNTVVKAAIAGALGGRTMAWPMALAAAAMFAAAGLTLALISL